MPFHMGNVDIMTEYYVVDDMVHSWMLLLLPIYWSSSGRQSFCVYLNPLIVWCTSTRTRTRAAQQKPKQNNNKTRICTQYAEPTGDRHTNEWYLFDRTNKK